MNFMNFITPKAIRGSAFARNSLILFGGTMAANILNYFFHLLVGRTVSVSAYGEVESLLSLLAITSIPSAAIMMLATKYSASCKAENDLESNYGVMRYLNKKVFWYGFPFFLIALALTPYLREFMNISSNFPIIIVWILMYLSFFGSITGGIINGWQKFKEANWTGILTTVVKLVSVIILIKVGLGAKGVMSSFLISGIFSYLISLYFIRFIFRARKKGKIDFKKKLAIVSIKDYLVPIFFGNLALAVLGNADMVLAKHNLDAVSAGQYGALTIVSKIIFFFTGVLASVLFSMSAEDSHKKNDSMKIFKQALCLLLFVSIVAIIAYFLFPKLILSLLFKNKYIGVAAYLGWFAIMVSIFSLVNLIFQYLLSIHKTKVVYSLLIVSIFAVLATLFLGKNIYAILLIMTIAQIVAALVCLFYLISTQEYELK
jgi:O-antigen/teichoic acid export membrane protein